MTISLLLCNDPLRPARCDPYFAPQAAAARQAGAEVALLDHDALLLGRMDEAVRRIPRGLGAAWYRGWMIPTAAYAELDAVLAERGVQLLTTATMYQAAHELPGWYAAFTQANPASTWIACDPNRTPEEPRVFWTGAVRSEVTLRTACLDAQDVLHTASYIRQPSGVACDCTRIRCTL
ncbi:hypothetical protein EDD99_4070 [Streptomyces sp. 846.5]|nr:hypothetical protein EDD99_4070 [Streptomyces sp. 846.5]